MDDLSNSDELAFVSEQVEPIIYEIIDKTLKDKTFSDSNVAQWTDVICESCISRLVLMKKPFKYIVDCVISQRNGAGIHSSMSSVWDVSSDNVVMARWPNEKHRDPNGSNNCMVLVAGLAV